MNQQYSSMPHQQPHTDQDSIRVHDDDQSANASESHDNHDVHELQQQLEHHNDNGHQSHGDSVYQNVEQTESDLLEKELEKITKLGAITDDDHDTQDHPEQHFEVQSHLPSVSPEAEHPQEQQEQQEHEGIDSTTNTHSHDHSSHNNDDSGNSNIDYLNNFSIEHMTNEDLAMHLQKIISDTSTSNENQTSETHQEQDKQRKSSDEVNPEDVETDSRAPTTEVDNDEPIRESEPVDELMTDSEPILASTEPLEQVQDPKETGNNQEDTEMQVSESTEQEKNNVAQETPLASEQNQQLEVQETSSEKRPESQLETDEVVSHTTDDDNDRVSAEIAEQIRRMEAQFKRDVEKEIEMERQKAVTAGKQSESNENDGSDKETSGVGSNDNTEKSSTDAAPQIESESNSISKSSSEEIDKTKTNTISTSSDKSAVSESSTEPSNGVLDTTQKDSNSKESASPDKNHKTGEAKDTSQSTLADTTAKFPLGSSSSSSSTFASSTSFSSGPAPASFVPSFARTVSSTKYKGIEIPVNSVLVNSESSALLAYKNLLQNSQQSSTTTTTQNSRKGSVEASGNDENSNKSDNKTDSIANANPDNSKDNISQVTAFVTPNNHSNQNPYRYQVSLVNAQLAALPLTITAPEYLSLNIQLLINTLPVLDNLATQILRIIAQGPYQKVMELVANTESYTSIAFGNLVELFETTKRMYNSEESPFFTVENATFGLWKYRSPAPAFLRGREETIEGTLRKVNLATFLLTALGVIDLGFFFLNAAFLDVFCPPQNLDPNFSISNLALLNELGSVTGGNQSNGGKGNSGINGISGYQFQNLSKGGGTLNQTKFLKSQAILFLELKTQAFISAIELGDKSKAEIIQDLFPDNLDEVLLKRKDPDFDPATRPIKRNSTMFTPSELDFLTRCESRKENLLKFDADADSSLMEKYEWIKFLNDLLDYVSKNVGFLVWGPKGKIAQELARLQLNESNFNEGSAPTDDQSKRKAAGEATPPPRKMVRHNRPGTFRRTWTEQEENALREGLKQKGTQWSAILSMYGPGGSINEDLKNRTTLQLKDKARNWKIYYMKNRLEVPDYLSKVTGSNGKHVMDARNRIGRPRMMPMANMLRTSAASINHTMQTPVSTTQSTTDDSGPSYEELLNNILSGTTDENPEDGSNDQNNDKVVSVSGDADEMDVDSMQQEVENAVNQATAGANVGDDVEMGDADADAIDEGNQDKDDEDQDQATRDMVDEAAATVLKDLVAEAFK
ncbi:unnamed protein product [Ambrosiozyma monospora]|uniref:Unnamed protein product n=1 Tax=Ambrosiozyma monospora TaxID=43982 RepID=A0A9W7DDA7_AMBMO|nr:unnamed protein product [Ambrosiozyma monospora]